MVNTDGVIIEKIKSVSDDKLFRISYLSVLLWTCAPFAVMVLNALGFDGYNVVGIWMVFLYIAGGAGLFCGGTWLFNLFSKTGKPDKDSFSALEPVFLLICFFLWCAVSIVFADAKRVAIYGYGAYNDNLFTYLFYGGMLLNGIVLSQSPKYLMRIVRIFLGVASVLSVLSLFNNKTINDLFFSNSYTSDESYRTVFLTADDFSLYLVLVVVIGIMFYIYNESKKLKLVWLAFTVLNFTALAFAENAWFILTPFFVLFFLFAVLTKENDPVKRKDTLIVFLILSLSLFCCIRVFGTSLMMNKDYAAMSGPLIENPEDTMTPMLDLWLQAIVCISQYPITGIGLQNTVFYSHNIFLQIGMYTGMIGLLLYISSFIILGKRLVKNWRHYSVLIKSTAFVVLSYLLAALTGITVFNVAPYFYYILGVCMSSCFDSFLLKKSEESPITLVNMTENSGNI